MTIEDLMKERGQIVKKGTLSEDGDVEFWEDGTNTPRANSKSDVQKSLGSDEGKMDNQGAKIQNEGPAMLGR
jgi:protein import protein ZIM17